MTDELEYTWTPQAIIVPAVAEGDLPKAETTGAAGLDLKSNQNLTLWSGERAMVGTGLKVAIPEGYYGQIRSRSGLGSKGIVAFHGTIDSDYRGEIKVILFNHNKEMPYQIQKGDRIAQLVLMPALPFELKGVDELATTDRGAGGFGSTGR